MGSSQRTTHTAYNQLVKSNWQNNERLILVIVPEEGLHWVSSIYANKVHLLIILFLSRSP